MIGDRYQSDKMEHGAATTSTAEDPTECFAKMQRLAKEDDVTIARAVRTDARVDRDCLPRQNAAAMGLDTRIPGEGPNNVPEG